MTQVSSTIDRSDTGLASIILLLRLHGIAASPDQLQHRFGGAAIGVREMLRCAKEFGVKARAAVSDWSRLAKLPLPAIAQCRDGSFIILGKVAEEKSVVQDVITGRPQVLSRSEFEAVWNGRLLLMTRRARLGDLARHFDVSWFLQAMHKYRRMLCEVLVASLRTGDAAVLPGGD